MVREASEDASVVTLAATDPSFNTGVVLVSRSADGGATFNQPVVAYNPPSSSVFPDKEWFAINTFAGTSTVGRIVVTFTLFGPSSTEGGQILRTYSDDAGATWSAVANVSPGNTSLQGSQPVFLVDGRAPSHFSTSGLIESMSREEVEAVIGHEISHIAQVRNLIALLPEPQDLGPPRPARPFIE